MLLGNRYIVDSVAEAYEKIGNDFLNNGAKEVSPRGIATREVIAPQIIIQDPRKRLVYNKGRKYNLMHALTESIMLHSSSDKVEHIGMFNSNMKRFSDDGVTMYGSYGKRISSFIEYIVSKLKADPDSRQAVLSIYKSIDMVTTTKDVPCTENLQFLIRDNKLHMVVNMRSNDILYGFQYDVVMFSMLQETIANTLEIDLGYYIHQPASLHVYEKYNEFNGYDMLEEMATKSESIRVINNSDIHDWKDLADVFTKKCSLNQVRLNGITRDIYELLSRETLYRSLKENEDDISSKTIGYFKRLSQGSPSWAKPFVKRWDNI